jgi:hypothetical protein
LDNDFILFLLETKKIQINGKELNKIILFETTYEFEEDIIKFEISFPFLFVLLKNKMIIKNLYNKEYHHIFNNNNKINNLTNIELGENYLVLTNEEKDKYELSIYRFPSKEDIKSYYEVNKKLFSNEVLEDFNSKFGLNDNTLKQDFEIALKALKLGKFNI